MFVAREFGDAATRGHPGEDDYQYVDFQKWGCYQTQATMPGAKRGENRYGVDACPVTIEVEVTNAARYGAGEQYVCGSNLGLPVHAPLPWDVMMVKAFHINLRWFKNFVNQLNPRVQRWLSPSRSEPWMRFLCGQTATQNRIWCGGIAPKDYETFTISGWRASGQGIWYCPHCAVWALEDWKNKAQVLA